MREICVICLTEMNAETVSFAIYDAEGLLLQSFYRAEVAILTDYASGRLVVIGVPAGDVIFTTVTLPKLSKRALQAALPYALESSLLAEPEALHYLVCDSQASGAVNVAMVGKDDMRAWLAQCEAWQVEPDVFIPMSLLLPRGVNEWSVVIGDMAWVRVDDTVGFICDQANLNAFLMAAMRVYGEPSSVQIHQTSGERLALNLSVPVTETLTSAAAMKDLFLGERFHRPTLNLLQGEFKVRQKRRVDHGRELARLRAGVGAWAALMLLVPLVSWGVLMTHHVSLRSQMKVLYQHQFPNDTTMAAPRRRFEEKLKNSEQARTEQPFFQPLSALGLAMKSVSGVQIKSLLYENHQFRLTLTAQSATIFSSWLAALSASGLPVKQQTVELTGERLNAVILIG